MARPKLGDGETQRLQLKITEEEIVAIDDWRFGNRVASRSEAVRRLCQLGAALDPWVRETPAIFLQVNAAKKAVDEARERYRSSTGVEHEEAYDVLAKAAAQLDDACFELNVHVEGMNRVLDALSAGKSLDVDIEEAKAIATRTAEEKAVFGGVMSTFQAIATEKGERR